MILPGGPHPIPFRTRSLSPSGPMVLRLKARESRSSPGLPNGCEIQTLQFTISDSFAAGWSSPVARQAHNLKVTGSNPVPAPKDTNSPCSRRGCFRLGCVADARPAIHAGESGGFVRTNTQSILSSTWRSVANSRPISASLTTSGGERAMVSAVARKSAPAARPFTSTS